MNDWGTEGRLRAEQDVRTFLTREMAPGMIGIAIEDWEHKRDSKHTIRAIQEARARHDATIEATRPGELSWAAPILIVNGRHLLIGSRFESLEAMLHTANRTVRRELEQAGIDASPEDSQ